MSYVYAIDNSEGAVKVGWARNPPRRVSELRVAHADPRLCLVGYAAGTREHEAELHTLLAPWRIRGEWFRREGHVLTFLSLLPRRLPRAKPPRAPVPASDCPILAEITDAAKRFGVTPKTLCQQAVKNAKLPDRLARGETITLATLNKLRAHIEFRQANLSAPAPAEAPQ